jgi:outer membrane protein assembly factor BamB
MFRSLAAITSLICATLTVSAADWPQWRGPNRDGVSMETGLLTSWPTSGPKLLWETKGLGAGFSTVAIAGGRIYTMGDRADACYLICLNEKDGKQVWATKVGRTGGQRNPGPRGTPTVDDNLVFVVGQFGDVVCVERAGGKEVWRKNFKKDWDGKEDKNWGCSESPLVDGDQVVVTPGGRKATLVALNKKTGKEIWTANVPGNPNAGHASAVIEEVGGIRMYVQTSAGSGFGVNAKDGKVLWTYPINATAVIPTPIVRGDYVFLDAGYGTGGALLKLVPSGDGVKAEELYGLQKELNNKHGGIVLVGDFLYADTDSQGTPYCADFMTGKVRWKERSRSGGKGSVAVGCADGNLYLHFENGQMVLAKAAPDGYKELSSFKVPHSGEQPSWTQPVICGGKLYVREQDWLMCYDVRQK